MKAFIVAVGVMCAGLGVYMGFVSIGNAGAKETDIKRAELQVSILEQNITAARGLSQERAIPLSSAYVRLMNDMNALARDSHALWSVTIEGSLDTDIERHARPSVITGLRELRAHGVFSGVASRVRALALLDALSAVEENVPVIFRSVTYEKDALMFDLLIIGP